MVEDNIKITYEILFELLRKEKSREELQELDPNFFEDAAEYIIKKKDILTQEAANLNSFSMDKGRNNPLQLDNIRKILKELYDRREKKIVQIALNKSRTNSNLIDTSSLLDGEGKLFGEVADALLKFRQDLLARVLEGRKSKNTPEQTPQPTEPDKNDIDNNLNSTTETDIPQKEDSEIGEPTNTPSTQTSEDITIRFLQDTNKFVGPDLEIYGPYSADDKAEFPSKIAEILINKGKAEQIKEGLINA